MFSAPGQYGQSPSAAGFALGRTSTHCPRVGSFLSSSTWPPSQGGADSRRPQPPAQSSYTEHRTNPGNVFIVRSIRGPGRQRRGGTETPVDPRYSLIVVRSFRRCCRATSTQSFSEGSCAASAMYFSHCVIASRGSTF